MNTNKKSDISIKKIALINIFIRSKTIFLKFILIFILAKFLNPDELGYFGIFSATVGIYVLFIGMDYYTYSTRKIIMLPKKDQGCFLKGQIYISLIMHSLSFFPMLYLLKFIGWSEKMIALFFIILILEHINQEIYRLLIVFSEQICASINLFIRQGSWIIALFPIFILIPSSRSIFVVLIFWSIGGFVALIFGLRKIYHQKMLGWEKPINKEWVFNGIRISLCLLISTLALRSIQTLDRYWIEQIGGIDFVGVYVLFSGISGSLIVLLDAGLFSFFYPKLIYHHIRGEKKIIQNILLYLLLITIIFCLIFSIIIIYALPYILKIINKDIYFEMYFVFPWILSATIINAISIVPHYGLYSQGKDRAIIKSNVFGFIIFIIIVLTIKPYFPLYSVPVALNIAFFVIAFWKYWLYWKSH